MKDIMLSSDSAAYQRLFERLDLTPRERIFTIFFDRTC